MTRTRFVRQRLIAAFAAAALLVAASAQTGVTRLDVRQDAELGPILVDPEGATLYLFLSDVDELSWCYDECAENWPPLLVEEAPAVGEGLDAELVGVTERTDGTLQATYGGWPLYTFVGDTEPGQTSGHTLNGVWFAVAPDGSGVVGETDADADDASVDAAAHDELFDALMTEGSRVFSNICAACHGAAGNQSLASHVPLLTNNRRLDDARLVVRRVLRGGGYMPGFGDVLSDREGAAVATYVRNSWGNEFGLVTEEEAAGWR
jgi:predicted lipoprotein with Yx(FWY)xxD motif